MENVIKELAELEDGALDPEADHRPDYLRTFPAALDCPVDFDNDKRGAKRKGWQTKQANRFEGLRTSSTRWILGRLKAGKCAGCHESTMGVLILWARAAGLVFCESCADRAIDAGIVNRPTNRKDSVGKPPNPEALTGAALKLIDKLLAYGTAQHLQRVVDAASLAILDAEQGDPGEADRLEVIDLDELGPELAYQYED